MWIWWHFQNKQIPPLKVPWSLTKANKSCNWSRQHLLHLVTLFKRIGLYSNLYLLIKNCWISDHRSRRSQIFRELVPLLCRPGVNSTNILRAAFFVRKSFEQLFCTYILGLYIFGASQLAHKLLVKCWWNRPQWFEPRMLGRDGTPLRLNSSRDGAPSQVYFTLDTKFAKNLWVPDVYIYHLKYISRSLKNYQGRL